MSSSSSKLEAIFSQAIAIPDQRERAAFLDSVCADDAKLRAQVQELVGNYFQAGSFLERPMMQSDPTVDSLQTSQLLGTTIGPYKLLQEIGEGGMGVVYMAEQTEPVARVVAIKIIKPGMDTRQVIARFEA